MVLGVLRQAHRGCENDALLKQTHEIDFLSCSQLQHDHACTTKYIIVSFAYLENTFASLLLWLDFYSALHAAHCNIATSGRAFQNRTKRATDPQSALFVCLFVFISGTMRFSRYGLGASYLATHNHSAIPEVTQKSSN
jgi:hypothetical protein